MLNCFRPEESRRSLFFFTFDPSLLLFLAPLSCIFSPISFFSSSPCFIFSFSTSFPCHPAPTSFSQYLPLLLLQWHESQVVHLGFIKHRNNFTFSIYSLFSQRKYSLPFTLVDNIAAKLPVDTLQEIQETRIQARLYFKIGSCVLCVNVFCTLWLTWNIHLLILDGKAGYNKQFSSVFLPDFLFIRSPKYPEANIINSIISLFLRNRLL